MNTSKHIAAAAASAAVVCAFGAGAFALAQSDPTFDPRSYTSAYSKGLEDATKGYEANPIESDAEANRSKDDASDNSNAASNQPDSPSQDAFTNTPANTASGTTAYNITGDTSQGSIGIATGSGSGNGSGVGSSDGGTVIAPVISGDGNNGNGTSGENNNSGGSSNGGNSGGQDTPTPNEPTREPLSDGDPVPDKKGDNMGFDPVNDSNKTLADIDVNDPSVTASVSPSFNEEVMLYVGQKIDAWIVFCSLEATLSYWEDGADWPTTVEWRCSRDQFDSYPYFKIVDFPETVPDEPFDIVVAWRIQADAEWNMETVTYTPAESRTYVVSTALDESGENQVLHTYSNSGTTINLFSSVNSFMNSIGALGTNGTLSKLLLGWTTDGQSIDYFFTPESGRHVIVPGQFIDVPNGYTVKLKNYWMNSDYSVPENNGGQYPCALQTLTNVTGETQGMLVPDKYGRISLALQPGIQAVDIEGPTTVSVDRLEIPDTLWYVDVTDGLLAVNQGFSVSSNNPNYANLANGILTNKSASQYIGIPLNFQTLDVPEGVESVNFTAGNNLKRVTLNAAHAGEIPAANWENLNNCNIVVDDSVFEAFATANRETFTQATGNTVSPKSDPSKQYSFSNDTLICDDEAVRFVDTGVDLVRVAKAHKLTAGCLDNCPNITTLVLTDRSAYTLEDNCLAGSTVRTIVCSTEEQEAYVTSRLEAAGAAPDSVYVTCASTSDEGYRFFTDVDSDNFPTTTVFEVPESTETFNGVGSFGEDGIAFSNIAAGTFENHPNLAWVDLADSVDVIGANAFNGCSKLQGVFITNEFNITVGVNAFANCPSMRFIASNAANGDFASDERPNDTCVMYAPTGCTGYHSAFLSFTPESGVEEYAVVQQGDGSLVLYGTSEELGQWLLLGAGSYINGRIELSPDTFEIYSNAFYGTQGNFTINWEDLSSLCYIDSAAFANCSVSGDVFVGMWWADITAIDDNAFQNCPNITSFTSDGANLVLGEYSVFANCTSLEYVKLAALDNGTITVPGIFDGCSNLRTIEFTSYSPIRLGVYSPTTLSPFLFNPSNTFEEEEETLHLEVPAYAQMGYLEQWLYPIAGASDYDSCYELCRKQLVKETDLVPTDVQVKQRMSEILLVAENHLRTMMGMPLVERSSFVVAEEHDGYVFELVNGVNTLTAAPEDATVVNFDEIVPDSLAPVAIGENAFAACKNLASVVITDKVSAINSGAFTGCDGVTVQLPETVSTQLAEGSASAPFTFGAAINLAVPESAVSDYLEAWPRQCLGIIDDDTMSDHLSATLFGGWDIWIGDLPTTDAFNEAVNAPFVEQENYLRELMGLDAINGTDELAYYHDASEWLEEYLSWFGPSPDPWPDLDPDDPWGEGGLDDGNLSDNGEGAGSASGTGDGADSSSDAGDGTDSGSTDSGTLPDDPFDTPFSTAEDSSKYAIVGQRNTEGKPLLEPVVS